MLSKVGEVLEPIKGYVQEIMVVPIHKLKVVSLQRKPSKFMVQRLTESMRKVGFITPVIAVKGEVDEYIIIDGQHRFLAAKEAGVKELLCIIVPKKYAHDLMELNIEKQMSIREKAYVALNVYRAYMNEEPSMMEDDPRIIDSIELPYYVTLGLAYEGNQRFFGSAYESILKRIDSFLSIPLMDALKERERRAKVILSVDEVARRVVEKLKEMGITHQFIYGEILSFCSPMGRKRKVEEDFNEFFEKVKENLKSLMDNPERFRYHESQASQEKD